MVAHHIKHWKVGQVDIARIVEVWSFDDDVGFLLPGATPELLLSHDWLRPHFATPEGRMLISFQAFAVRSQGRNIAVDTCIGNGRKRQFDVFTNMQTSYLDDMRIAGFARETIDTVLCTHLHFDHCGWNTMEEGGKWVPTFPKAQYLFGAREWEHWSQVSRTEEHAMHLDDAVQPILDAGLATFVGPEHKVTDEVWLEPTPGHTPGHVSVHICSEGQHAVITGDMMHHPVQLAVPDWHGHFDMDPVRAAETRRAFLERYEDRKALVIGSHFAEPTAGYVEKADKNWRFTVL